MDDKGWQQELQKQQWPHGRGGKSARAAAAARECCPLALALALALVLPLPLPPTALTTAVTTAVTTAMATATAIRVCCGSFAFDKDANGDPIDCSRRKLNARLSAKPTRDFPLH